MSEKETDATPSEDSKPLVPLTPECNDPPNRAVQTALPPELLEQLRALMTEQRAGVSGSTSQHSVSARNGQLYVNGVPHPHNWIDVIAVSDCHAYYLYADRYNPDESAVPICYALGKLPTEMKPHPLAAQPQAASCNECPNLAWGSAADGKGKRCSQRQRVLLVDADVQPGGVMAADSALLTVSVTSVKYYADFVELVARKFNLPSFGVVVRIKVQPDPKVQLKYLFEPQRLVDMALIPELLQRAQTADDELMRAFEPIPEPPATNPDAKSPRKPRKF